MDMSKEDIEMLFEACDPDGRGYLTLNEFERIGEGMNLSSPDVRKIFESMDTNNDGRVEQSEFLLSFHAFSSVVDPDTRSLDTVSSDGSHHVESQLDRPPQILITEDPSASPITENGYNSNTNNNTDREKDRLSANISPSRGRSSSTPRVNGIRSSSWHHSRKVRKKSMDTEFMDLEREYTSNQGSWDHFAESMGDVVYALSSYDGISMMYRHIESLGNAELLRNYENMIQGMVKEIGRLQKGMSDLEMSYEKANENSSAQLSMLEEEMESQIALKEVKVRDEERKRAEEESLAQRERYEEQIEQLQTAIKKLKQMDEKLSTSTPFERELETMREKVRKMSQENSELKSKLTESETNLILLQSTMAAMEVDHQERTIELVRDSDEVHRVIDEKERISKEVESLYSNNRKLLDSNDSLREALESSMTKYKRASTIGLRQQNGVPIELLNQSLSSEYLRSGRSSRASLHDFDALALCDPGRQTPEQCLDGYLHPDFDSGVGTLRDEGDDSETDWGDESFRRTRSARYKDRRSVHRQFSNASRSSWVSDSSRRSRTGHRRTGHRSPRHHDGYRTLSGDEDIDGTDVINDSDVTDEELQNISQSSATSLGSMSKGVRRSTRKVITPDITLGHNKRMYKVVLCGDSGTGKTSFIHRLCRGEFFRLSKSTLGVDFQIKTIEVEHDRSVSLQLWDTAGQERFRSISASYFRRAEGVLLLYDCTNQESFISVRDWMETITDAVQEGTPIMICGHKVDMREGRELANKPVVTAQEGAQLAANYGVLFVETSAMDGCNIMNAVTMLARHLKIDDDDDATSVKHLGSPIGNRGNPACCKQS